MKIILENISEFLSILGFSLKDGKENTYFKIYKNYEIQIIINKSSFKNSKIVWGNKITIENDSTSNFFNQENFVVLECVNRILDLGYSPESIVLEKNWKLGHNGKGRLDIWIKDKEDKSFLMVECKTWEKEYEKERENLFKDGGQLFSYCIQEKRTKFICLYASAFDSEKIIYKNEIVLLDDRIKKSQNQKEAFESWSPQITEKHGLFEKDTKPYVTEFFGLRKSELLLLSEENGNLIYKRFLEILRRNTVSDKTNAFNKIFNLFLCKIVDEDKRNLDEEVLFQWKTNEKNEEVLLTLNDLYKEGMSQYLELDISSVSEKELIESLTSIGTNKNKDIIRNLFIKQKLYSGNEFAFKEVFDKASFDENCIVVKEMVKLLESFQLKYSGKHQFLGEFFEKLLNDGIKQESGQYFTPIPLASFICKSLPIKEIIDKKNKDKETNILPYCIDYASGSGHFLTEVMEEINHSIQEINSVDIQGGKRAKDFFLSLKENFLWAKEYIYGIEKDYRLAKTTKINTFLNGDGDANIICGDGMDNFYKSVKYKGMLKNTINKKDNENFDILISNLPYSVSGFKNTVKDGNESFDLFSSLNDKSSEIEIIFMERAKQLLKEGGVAGIILPDSFFSAPAYSKIRDLILFNFNIKGLLELKDHAFMETDKNTMVLFLEKKKKITSKIKVIVDNFFLNFKDISFNNIKNIFSEYSTSIYGYSIKQYIDFFKSNDLTEVVSSELFIVYEDLFSEGIFSENLKKVLDIEKKKLFYFLLTRDQPLIFAQTGDSEKEFLGYEFHKGRNGMDIKIFKDKYNNNEKISKLYNENNLLDSTKLNYYIYNSFLGNLDKIIIDTSLNKLVFKKYLSDLFKFDKSSFENQIISKPSLRIISKFKQEPLLKSYEIVDSGTGAPQDKIYFKEGNIPFIRAGNLNSVDELGYVIPDKKSMINDLAIEDNNLKKFSKGSIVFPKTGKSCAKGNIGRLKEDSYIVNHLAVIYDENSLNLDFLYYFLEYYETSNLIPAQSSYPTINLGDVKKIKVPIIENPLKKNIVDELKKIDLENKKNKKELKKLYLEKYFKKEYY